MKSTFIIAVAVMTFLAVNMKGTKVVHAGTADVVLVVAVIGGAAYAGYHFSQNYEVVKKSAVEIDGGEVKIQMPTLSRKVMGEGIMPSMQEKFSADFVKLRF